MRNAGRVLSATPFPRGVGSGSDRCANIVGVYVSYLRKKLGEAGAPPLVETPAAATSCGNSPAPRREAKSARTLRIARFRCDSVPGRQPHATADTAGQRSSPSPL